MLDDICQCIENFCCEISPSESDDSVGYHCDLQDTIRSLCPNEEELPNAFDFILQYPGAWNPCSLANLLTQRVWQRATYEERVKAIPEILRFERTSTKKALSPCMMEELFEIVTRMLYCAVKSEKKFVLWSHPSRRVLHMNDSNSQTTESYSTCTSSDSTSSQPRTTQQTDLVTWRSNSNTNYVFQSCSCESTPTPMAKTPLKIEFDMFSQQCQYVVLGEFPFCRRDDCFCFGGSCCDSTPPPPQVQSPSPTLPPKPDLAMILKNVIDVTLGASVAVNTPFAIPVPNGSVFVVSTGDDTNHSSNTGMMDARRKKPSQVVSQLDPYHSTDSTPRRILDCHLSFSSHNKHHVKGQPSDEIGAYRGLRFRSGIAPNEGRGVEVSVGMGGTPWELHVWWCLALALRSLMTSPCKPITKISIDNRLHSEPSVFLETHPEGSPSWMTVTVQLHLPTGQSKQ
eukprot:PhF_6_TR37546/c0_g1_i1/m.55612